MTFIVLQMSNYSLVILCDNDIKVDFRILTALRAVRGSHTEYAGPALNAKLRCWPYGCSAHSLRCQSHHAQLSQLSGGGIFQQ